MRKYYYLVRFLLVKTTDKYIIGYLYNHHKVKPLHIMLLKTCAHVGQTKWMYFFSEDDDISEKYNTIWEKVSADI